MPNRRYPTAAIAYMATTNTGATQNEKITAITARMTNAMALQKIAVRSPISPKYMKATTVTKVTRATTISPAGIKSLREIEEVL